MRKASLSVSIDKEVDVKLQALWIQECQRLVEAGKPPRSRSQLVNDLLREAINRRMATE